MIFSTIVEVLERSAALWPLKEAVVVDDEHICYAELLSSSKRIAQTLDGLGLRAGDRAGIFATSSADYVRLFFGALLRGVVPVLVNTSWSTNYLASRLAGFKVKGLFVSEDGGLSKIVSESLKIAGLSIPVYPVSVPLAGGVERSRNRFSNQLGPATPAAVVFTAGTTGEPKACCVTHENILVKAEPFVDRLELTESSRVWLSVPMYQIGFLSPLIAALSIGATVITAKHFEARAARAALINEEVTHAYPIYLNQWLPIIYDPDFRTSDLHALTHLCLIGPARILRRVQKALPQCVVMPTYGGPEAAGGFCMPQASDPISIRLESCGRPFSGHEVRIVDPQDGSILAAETSGEIQLRGPGIPRHCDFDAHSAPFTPDGWLRTGDIGMLNESGELFYFGRSSEILNIRGKVIPANVLEAVLLEHPDVAMAQVLPMPHPVLGEAVSAFVERRPGSTLTALGLLDYCRARMTEDHLPRAITFVVDWPISASKIQKNVLARLPVDWRMPAEGNAEVTR